MSEVELKQVEAALAEVLDPEFRKPMMQLGMLSDIAIEGSKVTLKARLSAPSEALKGRIDEDLRKVLLPLGVTELGIEWTLDVPTRDTNSQDPVPGVRNVILVLSGKGGVGKSTVAVNLAVALKRAGARVGLLDADVYGPSVPTLMGITGHPRSEDGVKIQPLERFGVKLMSIGFLLEDPKAAVVWRGPMLHGALTQFLKDVEWGKLDYLVLDLPPGTGDVALTLAQRVQVSGVVLVTTPQEVALQDVYKAVGMCEKLNLPILGVVENMSYFVDPAGVRHNLFGEGGGQKIADYAKAPMIAQIPIDATVGEWGDKGQPVVQAAPSSAAAKAFTKLADDVSTRIAVKHFERGGGDKAPKTQGPARLPIIR